MFIADDSFELQLETDQVPAVSALSRDLKTRFDRGRSTTVRRGSYPALMAQN